MNENTPTLTQSQEQSAPWNDEEKEPVNMEVTVSMSISKTLKVPVSDYKVLSYEKDEYGERVANIDTSNCNLVEAVKNNIGLPDELAEYLRHWFSALKTKGVNIPKEWYVILDDCSDWTVDDFEVVPE